MGKRLFKLGGAAIIALALGQTAAYTQPQLVHYWNFNTTTSQAALLTPSQTSVAGASITPIAVGASAINVTGGTGQNFNVANLNARNGDASGTHLRFDNPAGSELEFALPTTGYQDAMVKFATRRSGSGAGIQNWSYSTDGGVTYTFLRVINPVDGDPTLDSLDFSPINAADNNPNFRVKVAFAAGSGGSVGNNRFDNFTLEGTSAGGPDTVAPRTNFTPANNAVNVAVNGPITIGFNEPVRRINNSLITSANVASLVELRLNGSTGALVPFTASFANNNLITVTPSATLQNRQQYYVALKADSVEDFSNNAIARRDSSRFTTIALQTRFNAGDMVFVAYRMNATNTEDEVALLPLVDILPGTFIQLTDAKFTTNTPGQCAGGITWTAPLNECTPAGTIITIQTSALVTNRGTVTGSGFGLSSGGDQVIVYTGTPAAPTYITALTSNDWIAANTACGGSLSMIPIGLRDGLSSINMSTAPGNVAGNSANAYYNGTQTGTPAQIRVAALDPANWVTAASGTAAQTWPAYSFPAPPVVTNASVLSATSIRLIFNTALDAASATSVANYTGIAGISSASMTSNGPARDTVTLSFSTPFTPAASYTLTVDNIRDTGNKPMACAYVFDFTYNPSVAFASNFIVTGEGVGTLNFQLNLTNPAPGSVELAVLGRAFSTAGANDYTLSTQRITFPGTSNTYNVAIPITVDKADEQTAEYFVVALRNPLGYAITGDTLATIYIKDTDRKAPAPTNSINLQYVGSFDPSGSNTSTCEVVAYDPNSRRLFTSSAVAGFLDIVDFSNPAAPVLIRSVDIKPYGGITSVAVKNGIVAVASPNANEQLPGSVLLMDTAGKLIKQLTVGALPDMVCFTPDGKKILTANEGQPSTDYSVDPEGSVSVIDVSAGAANATQSNVTTLGFVPFNATEALLISRGIRKTKSASTLAQDLEPEYIAVSPDSRKAWVTLQENNAIAEIDLTANKVADIWALGTKDLNVPGNGIDASDNNNEVLIANWPVKAYYTPDGVAHFSVNGSNYLVTANEGDEKEYTGFVERTTVGAADYKLDPGRFPNAAMLKQSYNLGRMRVTNLNGDIDGDGDFDEIYCLGSRSFSIWNADSRILVYDCGDDFERFTSMTPAFAPLFNSDHESNSPKSRSRAKGPEPEGVAVAEVGGRKYAFITLERIGGVMVYDVTNPQAPSFVDYKNPRSSTAYTGDHGPETMAFIADSVSPNRKPYLIVANEISGTLSIFEVVNNNPPVPNGVAGPVAGPVTFNVFPNPAKGKTVFFNRIADVEVRDIKGAVKFKGDRQLKLDIGGYVPGVYFVRTADGASAKFVVTE
jgi:hypothetical protein